MHKFLDGKRLVVTGGNGVLGAAIAQQALALGAEVIVLDVRAAAPVAGIVQHALDLADPHAVAALVARLGPLDTVCNVAGGFTMGAGVDTADDAQWDAMFLRNVGTLRAVLKAVVPGMKARGMGRIINVGALSALQGRANMGAYTAAKAVVMNLTQSLADEVAATAIRVNAVLPSIIDTPANRQDMPDADFTRWVAPTDIAHVVCFLASDLSRAIHGALIPVGGGQG